MFCYANFELVDQKLIITRIDDSKKISEYHGLIRALIQNMVSGVDQNFSKTLSRRVVMKFPNR
jgi:ribosomal protein L6P/L9E